MRHQKQGKHGIIVFSALQKTNDAWLQAHDTIQLTKAKAEYEAGYTALQTEAMSDGNISQNYDKYVSRLNKLKDATSEGIDNKQNAKQFSYGLDASNAIGLSKLQTAARSQDIEKNKVDFVAALNGIQRQINNSSTPAEVTKHETEREELIQMNVEAGTLTYKEASDYLDASIESTIKNEIAYDTATTKETSNVHEGLKQRADIDEDTRLELLEASEAKIKENEQRIKKEVENTRIQTYEQQFDAQQQFNDGMGEMSLEQSLSELDTGANKGVYDEGWAKARKQAILSTVGIDEAAQNEWEARMEMNVSNVAQYVDFGKKSKKKGRKNVEEYLKGVRELEIEILEGKAKGLTSEKQAQAMLKQLYNTKTAQASEYIATKDRWNEYDARDAYKNIFSKQLSVGDGYRATRMFFNESIALDKELNRKDGSKLAADITDRIKNENRVSVLAANDAVLEGETVDVDAAMLELGVSREDIAFTAKQNNMTEAEVISRLRSK